MSIKDILEINYKLLKSKGCLLITRLPYGAQATRYGNFTNKDIETYTKGFNGA